MLLEVGYTMKDFDVMMRLLGPGLREEASGVEISDLDVGAGRGG